MNGIKKLLSIFICLIICASLIACNRENGPVSIVNPTPTQGGNQGGVTGNVAAAGEASGMIVTTNMYSAGVRTDGSLLTHGNNSVGQLDTKLWRSVIFAAGNDTTLAGLTADGKVLLAGEKASTWTNAAEWTDIVGIAVGSEHIVGLKQDGTVVADGGNGKGQCDVSSWSGITQVVAAGEHTLGLTANSTVVAAGDNSYGQLNIADWSGVSSIATAKYHTVGLKQDGTAVSTSVEGAGDGDKSQDEVSGFAGITAIFAGNGMTVGLKQDGKLICAPSSAELEALENVAYAAIGDNHCVVMFNDGAAEGFGNNDNLQTSLEGWTLRPVYSLGNYVGFMPKSSAKNVIAIMTSLTGGKTITLKSQDGAELIDVSTVGTGTEIFADGTSIGKIVIMGDVNGDGSVNEYDAELLEQYAEGKAQLSGEMLAASMVGDDNTAPALAVRLYMVGEGHLAQFPETSYNPYADAYANAYAKNSDVVGWIRISDTVIDYPIMYGENWFYNDHDIDKKSTGNPGQGSIYAYYDVFTRNNAITGHNSRKSGKMFHDLHKVQDNKENLTTYRNRVFGIMLYGKYSEWEIFSIYETNDNEPTDTLLYNTAHMAEAAVQEIQAWIDKQISRSEIELGVRATPDDTFITLVTCGDNFDYSDAQSRLYIFLKRVG